MTCPCCNHNNINDLDNTFDAKRVDAEARDYLRKGLTRRAQKLIAYLQPTAVSALSVLEIGCGAGAVHQELLRRGVAKTAVGVDAASASIAAARRNAATLRLTDQTSYKQGDFAQNAQEFDPADLVILDRVICCYPYLQQLLGAAAERSTRYLALSFPYDNWALKAGFRLVDAVLTLMGSGYHPYLHPHDEVLAIAARAGLQPVYHNSHFLWRIILFERAPAAA